MNRKQWISLGIIVAVICNLAAMVTIAGAAIKENERYTAECIAKGREEVRVHQDKFSYIICAKVEELK